jgi:hypothetical protein
MNRKEMIYYKNNPGGINTNLVGSCIHEVMITLG